MGQRTLAGTTIEALPPEAAVFKIMLLKGQAPILSASGLLDWGCVECLNPRPSVGASNSIYCLERFAVQQEVLLWLLLLQAFQCI